MADYRLYFMNSARHIEEFLDLHATDDEEAVRVSEMHRTQRAMELWFGGRKVRRWEYGDTNN